MAERVQTPAAAAQAFQCRRGMLFLVIYSLNSCTQHSAFGTQMLRPRPSAESSKSIHSKCFTVCANSAMRSLVLCFIT